MKKHLSILLALLLIAALPLGALAEDAELLSEVAELTVPEEDVLLGGVEAEEPGYADFVGEVAVSAAGDVEINETNFPDEIFRDYVSEELDTDGDGVLSEDERASVTEIDVDDYDIASLEGIEWFTELDYLYCLGNDLTNLDVSKNANLERLSCSENQLTRLDVSKNTKLVRLYCDTNQLTSLDVSKNVNLERLSCSENQLTRLDVSKNTKLVRLYCDINQLTSLDVSKNTKLVDLYCDTNQLTSLDVSKNVNLELLSCSGNQLTRLDVSKNTKLVDLYCDTNQLTSLDVSKNTELVWLYCKENDLNSLDVSKNTKLKYLRCNNNQLTTLDVSKNNKLMSIYADRNALKNLDVSNNVWLAELSCWNNNISDIDISNCPMLCDVAKTTLNHGGDYVFFEADDDYYEYYIAIDPDTALIANGKAVYGTLPTPAPIDLSKADITVKAQTYTGKALKPAVTVKLGKTTLKKGTDYTVKYKNNTKIGKATVTVKGKGNYTGSVKKTFKINPKKVKGLALKAGKKQIKVTWKKASGVTAYQVQYATKKDFSNAKKVTVTKAATIKTTIKKLKAKKTYYVRIRTYKKVSGKKYYSKWSSAKKIKTK